MTKKPGFIPDIPSNLPAPSGFFEVFTVLKQKIQEARLCAAISVNQKLIQLYWEMGEVIVENQKTQKWGARVLESLGKELQKSFPGMAGFSRANLFKMRAFYLAYQKVSRGVRQFGDLPIAQIPWVHNLLLITKIKEEKGTPLVCQYGY